MNAPICGYCGRAAVLTTGLSLYPDRPKLASAKFWHCEPCEAWVGCHPAGQAGPSHGSDTVPLGSLANAELRRWRSTAHQLFDELWKSRTMTRQEAYVWMGRTLGLPPSRCHIAEFDVAKCRTLVQMVAARG